MILCVALTFAACKDNKTENVAKENIESTKPAEEEESPLIEITPEQMKAVGIETDTVQQKDLTSSIKVNGVLTVPNQNKALVTSVTNGVIRTLHVQPGDQVRQGQLIATIINPDVAPIQQQLQVTNAQISLAQVEQARQQELVNGNAGALKNLQRATTELTTLRATRNSLQQQLRTMGISSGSTINTTLRVLAPITGTVSAVSAQIGSNVDASTPIAQIVNNSQLHLDIFIYEKDLARVKEKQNISFSLTNLQGKVYAAEIYSVGSAFANETKTIPVHAVVKGDKTGLIDGMNITASISTGTEMVTAVPTESIVTNAGQDFIFIVSNKKHEGDVADSTANKLPPVVFEKWAVTKGVADAGFTQIIPVNPMPAGAKIVSKGAFFVLAKMTNKGEEE